LVVDGVDDLRALRLEGVARPDGNVAEGEGRGRLGGRGRGRGHY